MFGIKKTKMQPSSKDPPESKNVDSQWLSRNTPTIFEPKILPSLPHMSEREIAIALKINV